MGRRGVVAGLDIIILVLSMDGLAPSASPPKLQDLRSSFPVLERQAYLNAGTDGPLPAAAIAAGEEELERELSGGRTAAHFERRHELGDALRAAYAALLHCPVEDLALTTCTSEGISLVVGGLGLSPGDEILTSEEEHPGLLGSLLAAAELDGVELRLAPLQELAEAVGPRTRLVACSHVSWVSGARAPEALAELGPEVPVLYDGAQGVGAVPLDVGALRCAAYAGSGQKWLCGPDGMGMLYVSPELRSRLAVRRRGYGNLENPNDGLQARLHEDARRFDAFSLSAETLAMALASLELFEQVGWPALFERAHALAARLAEELEGVGREVRRRAAGTLVSFSSPDSESERDQLSERGVVVRNIPGHSLLRASVGAWNDESDLERLLAGLTPA